jgi:hypothetical protein
MEKRAKGQTVQLRLRIRESLRARLEKDARRGGISLNAEVERRLEASYTQPPLSEDNLAAIVARAISQLPPGSLAEAVRTLEEDSARDEAMREKARESLDSLKRERGK